MHQIIQDDLGKEFPARLDGKEKGYNSFDLKDIDKLGLKQLTGDLRSDVTKVVLWADEKRRTMEDFRALRRNRNDWLQLLVAIALGVIVPFIVRLNNAQVEAIVLAPQAVLLAYRTIRRY